MKSLVVALLFVLSAFGSAEAGPITTGVMTPKPTADNSGTPFYHGESWDCPSAVCNAGAIVPDGLAYLHDGAGGAVAFGFSPSAAGWCLSVEDLVAGDGDFNDAVFCFTGGKFQFLHQATAFHAENVLSWRDMDSLATGIIFDGSDGPGAVASVSLPARFSFCYQPHSFQPCFDSWTDKNHFALFGPASTSTVPEPASLLLLGAGLLAVAVRLRRY